MTVVPASGGGTGCSRSRSRRSGGGGGGAAVLAVCLAVCLAVWSPAAAAPGGNGRDPIQVPAAMPVLDEVVRTVLAATDDDTDRLGEPVAAVLDVVRQFRRAGAAGSTAATAAPVPLDVAAVLASPEAWRGRAVQVEGRLEQSAPRRAAGADVVEWFVRPPGAASPVAILVIQPPPAIRPGAQVRVDGWVIRRAAAVSRDGVRRRYPLLVAADGRIRRLDAGRPTGGRPGGWPRSALVALAAVLLGGVVLLRLVRRLVRPRREAGAGARGGARGAAAALAARRAHRDRDRRRRPSGEASSDESASTGTGSPTLPVDPADALAAMRADANAPAAGDSDEERPA